MNYKIAQKSYTVFAGYDEQGLLFSSLSRKLGWELGSDHLLFARNSIEGFATVLLFWGDDGSIKRQDLFPFPKKKFFLKGSSKNILFLDNSI